MRCMLSRSPGKEICLEEEEEVVGEVIVAVDGHGLIHHGCVEPGTWAVK